MVSDPVADLARLEGVPSAVTATRAAVDLVLRDRGLRRITTQDSIEALLAGAEASAELSDRPEIWRPGALRLATEVPALSQILRAAPAQALSRAHVLVARGCVDDDRLGWLRPDSAVMERMSGLVQLLTTPSDAPALVLAAVVHGELASLAPFGAADDVVARAAEHMVLISAGVDPGSVLVPAAGHLARRAAYASGLRAYADGSLAGVRAWLLHCLEAVTVGAERSPLARGDAARREAKEP